MFKTTVQMTQHGKEAKWIPTAFTFKGILSSSNLPPVFSDKLTWIYLLNLDLFSLVQFTCSVVRRLLVSEYQLVLLTLIQVWLAVHHIFHITSLMFLVKTVSFFSSFRIMDCPCVILSAWCQRSGVVIHPNNAHSCCVSGANQRKRMQCRCECRTDGVQVI